MFGYTWIKREYIPSFTGSVETLLYLQKCNPRPTLLNKPFFRVINKNPIYDWLWSELARDIWVMTDIEQRNLWPTTYPHLAHLNCEPRVVGKPLRARRLRLIMIRLLREKTCRYDLLIKLLVHWIINWSLCDYWILICTSESIIGCPLGRSIMGARCLHWSVPSLWLEPMSQMGSNGPHGSEKNTPTLYEMIKSLQETMGNLQATVRQATGPRAGVRDGMLRGKGTT